MGIIGFSTVLTKLQLVTEGAGSDLSEETSYYLSLGGIFAIPGEAQHLCCVHLQPLEDSRGKP